ncbi:MAG: caspase family protein [Thermoplasmata archaeon]|nr:caspase family protein [Thermoplasmata archaeon]
MKLKNVVAILIIAILFIPSTISPFETGEKETAKMKSEAESAAGYDGSHYWALLVAVGVYAYTPDMDRPSMLRAVDDLYNTLLVSPFWNKSHIKVIKGENATVINIFKGFEWLAKNAKENDICLIYLTTHGFPIIFDFPPKDEADGMDEALAAYRGFLPFSNPFSWEPLANPFGIITDDEINFMLNRIHAKGIAMIVDSCHSGGFNDNWSYAKGYDMAYEIGKDLAARNRVILTSVREEEVSYGSFFSDSIIDGLKGYADSNKNGFVSAEEAFYYARDAILNNLEDMHPQIFDDYPGELDLTSVELPPSTPSIEGNEIGNTNISYVYKLVSYDPEGDRIKYEIDWGDSIEETSFYNSGEIAEVKHSWKKEGTYEIRVRAVDEHGAYSEWNESLIVTMAYPNHKIDQRQVNEAYAYLVNDTRWLAQSFIPSVDSIKKIELALICWDSGEMEVELRDALDGNIVAKASKQIEATNDWEVQWIGFNMEANVTSGKEYYIVCHSSAGWGLAWVTSSYDAYSHGKFYHSRNSGEKWESHGIDACFVTYG